MDYSSHCLTSAHDATTAATALSFGRTQPEDLGEPFRLIPAVHHTSDTEVSSRAGAVNWLSDNVGLLSCAAAAVTLTCLGAYAAYKNGYFGAPVSTKASGESCSISEARTSKLADADGGVDEYAVSWKWLKWHAGAAGHRRRNGRSSYKLKDVDKDKISLAYNTLLASTREAEAGQTSAGNTRHDRSGRQAAFTLSAAGEIYGPMQLSGIVGMSPSRTESFLSSLTSTAAGQEGQTRAAVEIRRWACDQTVATDSTNGDGATCVDECGKGEDDNWWAD